MPFIFLSIYVYEGKLVMIFCCFRCLDRLIVNWSALKDFFKEEERAFASPSKRQPSASTSKDACAAPMTCSSSSVGKSSAGVRTSTSGTSTKSSVSISKGTSSASAAPEQSACLSESEKTNAQKKAERILKFLRSPTNKLYCLFLQYTHKVFADFLTKMQSEEPQIHVLRGSLMSLMRKILVRFVKPSATSKTDVLSVQYKLPYNQKNGPDLCIGEDCTQFIKDKDKNGLKQARIDEFYSHVKKYFIVALDYMKSRLPMDDPVLMKAEVADLPKRTDKHQSDLSFFLDRHKVLIPAGATKNVVLEEFALLQATDVELPTSTRMDNAWTHVSSLKDEAGQQLFAHLPQVMKGILSIPHSNAHCERVFSCVRKNRTDQRTSLGDKTLESLLVVKSRPGCALDPSRCLSHKQLKSLKSCYFRELKETKKTTTTTTTTTASTSTHVIDSESE